MCYVIVMYFFETAHHYPVNENDEHFEQTTIPNTVNLKWQQTNYRLQCSIAICNGSTENAGHENGEPMCELGELVVDFLFVMI